MKTNSNSAAWENDSFWREVVAVLTNGKKLRGEHYLQGMDAGDLEQLRSALSFAGTLLQQQALCPKRRGGATEGELPPVSLLSQLAQAVREVTTLRALARQDLISAATKDRCGQLGLDPQLTNAVVRVVAEEALRQQAQNQVGNFAISAANVLLMAEGMRTKGKQEEVKISLRQRAEQRMSLKLKMEMDKRLDAACEKLLDAATRAKADEINASSMSQAAKIQAMRQEYFKDVDELMASGKVVLPE
jgi:hypothetical protein